MANISVWLQEFEKQYGETIEAIVVGRHYNRDWEDDKPRVDENVVLTREQGLEKLNLDYDNGFGGADCYPMYAWTKDWIILIGEYDGATGMNFVPRNPQPCEPQFGGA